MCKRPKSLAKIHQLTVEEVMSKPEPFWEGLTEAEQRNYNEYQKIKGSTPRTMCQLNQMAKAGFGARSWEHRVLPCIIRNVNVLYSFRSMLPVEMLQYQLFPVCSWMPCPSSGQHHRCCSFAPSEEEPPPKSRTRTSMALQAGNTMNCAVVHALMS